MSLAHREDRDFMARSRRDVPPAKQRRTGATKTVDRMKYYSRAAAALEAAAGSLAAAELLQRRRLLRVMRSRMAEFAAGESRPHTTHQWHQYHLREAGGCPCRGLSGRALRARVARAARAQVGPQAAARAGPQTMARAGPQAVARAWARERHCDRKRLCYHRRFWQRRGWGGGAPANVRHLPGVGAHALH